MKTMPCFSPPRRVCQFFITDNYRLTHMRIYLPLVITSAKLLFKFGRNEWIYGRVVLWVCVCVNVMQKGYLSMWENGERVWWRWWARAWFQGRTGNACADGRVMRTQWERYTGNSLLCSCLCVFICVLLISSSSLPLYSKEAMDEFTHNWTFKLAVSFVPSSPG